MELDKTREITIRLSEREMNAIEDIFFCENTETLYKKMRPLLVRVWKKLCKEMDK
jgi:hypothetical protein